MITVYTLLKESGLEFSRFDIMEIGETVSMAYLMDFDKNPQQVEQVEDGKTFTVNSYPDDFRERMEKIIVRYYEKKSGNPYKKYTYDNAKNIASEK